MTKTWMGALLALGLTGCSSDSPPGASIAANITLPASSSLASLTNASLLRAGDSFTLAGYDGAYVRWGRVSLDGVLTQETSFALAQPARGPFFAATMNATPGDQLVALVVDLNTSGTYDLSAIVQDEGAAAPAAPVVLATFPAGVDLTTVQVAAGAATSGDAGFVAWGFQGTGGPVYYLFLRANAANSGTPGQIFGDPITASNPDWECLATTGGTNGLGFTILRPIPGLARWSAAQLDEAGSLTNTIDYDLIGNVDSCQIVGSATTTGGYDIAFQNPAGISLSTFYPSSNPSSPDGTVITNLALATADFSGPLAVPHPAWVASAGSDVSIGLERTAGPEVVRFTYDATPHGAALPLPSANGQTDPVSAWVGSDGVYVTYTDHVASSGTSPPTVKRHFIKIVSPAQLP
jgi:hypothetical protein